MLLQDVRVMSLSAKYNVKMQWREHFTALVDSLFCFHTIQCQVLCFLVELTFDSLRLSALWIL